VRLPALVPTMATGAAVASRVVHCTTISLRDARSW
jgi:hypothetical protein